MRIRFVVCIAVLSGLIFSRSASAFAAGEGITFDSEAKYLVIHDASGNISLRVNVDDRCIIDSVKINGIETVRAEYGVRTGVKVRNKWYSTRNTKAPAQVSVAGNTAVISGIRFGSDKMRVEETWTFTANENSIDWRIERTYLNGGVLDDTYFAGWDFSSMDTWTGALLDTGGVAWSRFLERPRMTLGNHAREVTFWNRQNDAALRITPTVADRQQTAAAFTHQPGGAFTFIQSVSDAPFETKYDLSRFLADKQDVWKPFSVAPGTVSIQYRLQALKYSEAYDLGELKGIDESAVREVFNTILRYGVLDKYLTGGNGWRSGYVCLQEQWYSGIAAALGNSDYTRNLSDTYDYYRQNAVKDDGRVPARFKYDKNDSDPATYTDKGFYEPVWGIEMDSQPDYVIVVSEQFHNTADIDWLKGQKKTCEKALDFLLARDSDNDGLLEMMTDYHSEGKSSDWIDVMWASHENAFVNAEMYYAMTLWSELEKVLGDEAMAKKYAGAAAKLKARFNRDVASGGFWNPEKQWYVYWRDKDDSIHGDNLVIPVNFMTLAYGVCDDAKRKEAILSQIEEATAKENLFTWPLNIYPYASVDEGAAKINFPFPRYENGDLFLSWDELGVRIYADYDPAIAMKYVRSVLNHYERDGLAHQRYTRIEQKGVGDDILSGNGNAIVGLYSSIYGIKPRYDRLYLNPHLTPEVNGTKLKYRLRDQNYNISLSMNDYTIEVEGYAVHDVGAFGVQAQKERVNYYRDLKGRASLSLRRKSSGRLSLDASGWAAAKPKWTAVSAEKDNIEYTVSGLSSKKQYCVYNSSAAGPAKLHESGAGGILKFSAAQAAGTPVHFAVAPADTNKRLKGNKAVCPKK
ncbi:MAG: hypothetical protein WCX65_05300 [bacterium]